MKNEMGGNIRRRIRKRYLSLEEQLTALPRQRLILLVIVVSFLFVCLGALLGALIVPSESTPSSSDGGSSDSSSQEATSYTGILRQFLTPENGIEFYLERSDDSQILLDFSDRFDSSFIRDTYVGTVVTVRGAMAKSADGSQDIFTVEEIVIKY